jgi:hypothetical protein
LITAKSAYRVVPISLASYTRCGLPARVPAHQLNRGWRDDHPDTQRAGDHVIVGDDVSIRIDNHSRTDGALPFQGLLPLILSFSGTP